MYLYDDIASVAIDVSYCHTNTYCALPHPAYSQGPSPAKRNRLESEYYSTAGHASSTAGPSLVSQNMERKLSEWKTKTAYMKHDEFE